MNKRILYPKVCAYGGCKKSPIFFGTKKQRYHDESCRQAAHQARTRALADVLYNYINSLGYTISLNQVETCIAYSIKRCSSVAHLFGFEYNEVDMVWCLRNV